jgi:hypothetical protein
LADLAFLVVAAFRAPVLTAIRLLLHLDYVDDHLNVFAAPIIRQTLVFT